MALPPNRRIAVGAIGVAVAALILACGVTEPRNVPRSLRLVGDSTRTGTVGAPLAAPFTVELLGDGDRPVSGRAVHFAVADGAGSVRDTAVRTDASGQATTVVTLGQTAGRQRFIASYAGIASIEIRVAATAGAPATISTLGGDGQRDTVGRKLAFPFLTVVQDAYGNVVSDVAVAWSLIAGGGTLDSATSRTDSNGVARMGYTLGARARVDSVKVTTAGIPGGAQFTARGVPPSVARLDVLSGAGQTVTAGRAAATAPAVRAFGASGSPVVDAEVTFTPATGAAPIVAVADSDGVARLTTWTVSTRAGADSLVAASGGVRAVVPVTVVPGSAARLVVTTAPPDSVISGRPFARALAVAVADTFGNPIGSASANVTVGVAQGGGTLSGTTTVATTGGSATFADLRISGGGVHRLAATASGLDSASASLTVLVAPTLVAYDSAIAVLNVGDSVTPRLTVRDSAGVVVSGAQMAFVARAPSVVALSPYGNLAGSAVGQTLVVASSTVSPAMRDSMLAVVALRGQPVVRTDLAGFVVAPDSALDVVVYADMRGPTPVGSAAIDVRWSTSQLALQSAEPVTVGSGVDPVVTVGQGGIARVAFADATGFGGRVPVVRLRFRAASTAAPIVGTLALTVRELGGADAAFTALGPGTAAITNPLVVRP